MVEDWERTSFYSRNLPSETLRSVEVFFCSGGIRHYESDVFDLLQMASSLILRIRRGEV